MPKPSDKTLIASPCSWKSFVRSMLLMDSTLGLGIPILAQRPIDSKTGDSAPPPVTTLKTNVRRVSVDVVVTDRNDRPVTGLTQQDFSVAEDNAAQPVRTFEFHSMVG